MKHILTKDGMYVSQPNPLRVTRHRDQAHLFDDNNWDDQQFYSGLMHGGWFESKPLIHVERPDANLDPCQPAPRSYGCHIDPIQTILNAHP